MDHAPTCVATCILYIEKGCSRCIFTSRVMISIQKLVNSSTRLWHYMVNSFFSNVIDREATKVSYISVHSHSMNIVHSLIQYHVAASYSYIASYLTIQLATYLPTQLYVASYLPSQLYSQLPNYLQLQLYNKLQIIIIIAELNYKYDAIYN